MKQEVAPMQPHEIELEVDGGIVRDTIGRPARAGATAFRVGSALFGHRDGLADEVALLRGLAESARSHSSHDKEAA
jgi:ribulose-phosphate 3-epimerase